MIRTRTAKTAIGRAHQPIAALALLALLVTGCSDDVAGAAHGGPAASESPAPDAPALMPSGSPVTATRAPAIPRISAALQDRPVLGGQPPIRLVAADLGIDVHVEPVGLDAEGRMALPEDLSPSVAAWYSYGAAPGDPAGSAVIAAHVDSLVYDIGPFSRLADAPGGTEFDVTSADGTVRRFALESIDLVLKGTADWSTVFRRDGSPVLTLVTCGGEFDWSARRYLSTVIVTARATG